MRNLRTTISVSYTHLDVYKRQFLQRVIFSVHITSEWLFSNIQTNVEQAQTITDFRTPLYSAQHGVCRCRQNSVLISYSSFIVTVNKDIDSRQATARLAGRGTICAGSFALYIDVLFIVKHNIALFGLFYFYY